MSVPEHPGIEVHALAPPQWPLWRAYGNALPERHTRLVLRLPGGGAAGLAATAAGLIAAHDALHVTLRRLPGLHAPVQEVREELTEWSGEADARVRVVREADPAEVVLAVPSAFLDPHSAGLLAGRALDLLAGNDPTAQDFGYLDAVEWFAQTAELRSSGGGPAFRSMASRSERTDGAGPRYTETELSEDVAQLVAAACTARRADFDDVLTAALGVVALRTADGPPGIARVLHGRWLPELADVVGRLDLLGPVDLDLSGNPDTDEILARVARSSAEAQARYQRDPAATALASAGGAEGAGAEGSGPGGAGPAVPRYAVAGAPRARTALLADGTEVSVEVRDDDPGPCEVLVRHETHPRPRLRVRYDERSFTAADAERLASRLTAVVRRFAEDGPVPLSSIGVVGPRERTWIRARLTGAETPPPRDAVHRRILAHADADAAPAREAVIEGERQLTFRQLRDGVRGLAHRLGPVEPGEEPFVGIMTERLSVFVVSALAAMETGRAFVALERTTPGPRLRHMLDRLGVRTVLSDTEPTGLPPTVTSVPVDPWADPPPSAGALPPDRTDTRCLAYAVFTSGSTGVPKAVSVEHRHLAAYAGGVRDVIGAGPDARAASPAPYSVDLGYTALFPVLAEGGAVVALPPEARTDPRVFAAAMTAGRVTLLKITPSHLSVLLEHDDPAACLPSRTLVLGGEPLPPRLPARIAELRPALRVVNHYGPAEATVGTFTHEVTPGTAREVPLGSPLARVRAAVRGEDGGDCPVGSTGRLFLGGPAVARGYAGDPRQTADRFLPDPQGPAGARIYDTGDLAALAPDGTLRFHGRADTQLKIRGYRVEPAEIEHVLAAHPAVSLACVLPRQGEHGGLVAYARAGAPVEAAALERHLRDHLPDFCVPAHITVLDEFPLLPNGKVDRAGLARREAERPTGTAPRDSLERLLTLMWCELLDVTELGVDRDLFQAGAHSLTVTQALSRVREYLDVEVTIESFFTCPTIESFARFLTRTWPDAGLLERSELVCQVLTMDEAQLDALLASGAGEGDV